MKKFVLSLVAASMVLGLGISLRAEEGKAKEGAHKSCCEKAKEKGEECKHKCCVKAKEEGKTCEKCNPPKEEKKTT